MLYNTKIKNFNKNDYKIKMQYFNTSSDIKFL